MPAPQDPSSRRRTNAEAKFEEFLREKAEGKNPSIDELRARHPEDETALRMLHSVYGEGRSAGNGPSLAERLERFFGATVA